MKRSIGIVLENDCKKGQKAMACPTVKKRWKYIDLLRACSILLVILYHYEVDLEITNLVFLDEIGIRYTNIHMAQVGVALFFMVSGFGLMHSCYNEFSIKTFLKRDGHASTSHFIQFHC